MLAPQGPSLPPSLLGSLHFVGFSSVCLTPAPLHSSPFQPNWSPSRLLPPKVERPAAPSPLSTPVILVSRPITGATTRPNRQCHNFTWSHFGGEPHSFSPTLADGVLQQPTFSLALPACLSTILEMLAPFVSAMVEAAR